MCGIFGYFDQQGKSVASHVLKEMGDVINHRGPDGQGIYNDDELAIGLGNQRLAILDLEHGEQPFYSYKEDIVVVQNGEIFNHVELAQELKLDGFPCKTHCDTEVILRLYERDGIQGISCLNGMFAIAIYDKNKDSLYLIRDRVGEKPLYFSRLNDRIIFGSEIKSILKLTGKPSLDFKALQKYLAFNYVPMPDTMFNGVKHVKPGSYLEINRNECIEHKWWNLSNANVENKSETEWITHFNSVLDDAVDIRLRSDVPFGAFLSGGVDSSSVVGLMSKHMKTPVKTYCIGFDDPKYDESPFAREAAERFNTDHTQEIVEPNLLSYWPLATYHSDQPHGDVSFLPTYCVAKLASKDVKMVLTGDGADELFAGYDKYKNFFTNQSACLESDIEFSEAYSKNIALFAHEDIKALLSEKSRNEVSEENICLQMVKELISEVPQMDRINQALYIDTQLLLSGNNLVKPDRMGMAVSIENRAPFLDYRMIELAFSIPGKLKLNNGETKYIYKKAVSKLIGERLAYRKKQMFTVPVGEWFKDKLKPLCEDLLLSERTKKREIFNYDQVRKLLLDHCDETQNNTREIRALMAFEYWCREFLD
ncbi:MAG: asparagine synthase (glutamine-hydrolyzing) [Oleiphilus sp.]